MLSQSISITKRGRYGPMFGSLYSLLQWSLVRSPLALERSRGRRCASRAGRRRGATRRHRRRLVLMRSTRVRGGPKEHGLSSGAPSRTSCTARTCERKASTSSRVRSLEEASSVSSASKSARDRLAVGERAAGVVTDDLVVVDAGRDENLDDVVLPVAADAASPARQRCSRAAWRGRERRCGSDSRAPYQ